MQQMTTTIALFGEAEKGKFQTAYFCESLDALDSFFGSPPPDTRGLYYAVQALLSHCNLLFFRVQEEGFSYPDYIFGLRLLQTQNTGTRVTALCLPGIGDQRIIQAATSYCLKYHTLMIAQEADLYDYLAD